MRITDMNWMQVEAYLQGDNRAVVPLGSGTAGAVQVTAVTHNQVPVSLRQALKG